MQGELRRAFKGCSARSSCCPEHRKLLTQRTKDAPEPKCVCVNPGCFLAAGERKWSSASNSCTVRRLQSHGTPSPSHPPLCCPGPVPCGLSQAACQAGADAAGRRCLISCIRAWFPVPRLLQTWSCISVYISVYLLYICTWELQEKCSGFTRN